MSDQEWPIPTDARTYLGRVGVGQYLQITVSDTGAGIKPEVRRRLDERLTAFV